MYVNYCWGDKIETNEMGWASSTYAKCRTPEHSIVRRVENHQNQVKARMYVNYCWGDKIETNEMGWASTTYVKDERRIRGFGGDI